MTFQHTRRFSRALMLGGLAAVLLFPTSASAAPGDLMPDLGIGAIRDILIQKPASGGRLLRFSSTMTNRGAGPFIVHGFRDSSSDPWLVRQKIRNSDGGYRWIDTAAGLKFTGDGHNHWHIKRTANYDLYALTDTGTTLRTGAKVGFCFFDTTAIDRSLPGAPQSAQYRESTCGVSSSTHVWMGLSVGWGDTYPWNFYKQWIDISRLPPGSYRICVTVDRANDFRETNEENNQSYADVVIDHTAVSVIDRVQGTPCATP